MLPVVYLAVSRLKETLDQRGVSSAEYALLIAFIAVIVVAGATALGASVSGMLSNIASTIGGGGGGGD